MEAMGSMSMHSMRFDEVAGDEHRPSRRAHVLTTLRTPSSVVLVGVPLIGGDGGHTCYRGALRSKSL